jgi:hypothetical protein
VVNAIWGGPAGWCKMAAADVRFDAAAQRFTAGHGVPVQDDQVRCHRLMEIDQAGTCGTYTGGRERNG